MANGFDGWFWVTGAGDANQASVVVVEELHGALGGGLVVGVFFLSQELEAASEFGGFFGYSLVEFGFGEADAIGQDEFVLILCPNGERKEYSDDKRSD